MVGAGLSLSKESPNPPRPGIQTVGCNIMARKIDLTDIMAPRPGDLPGTTRRLARLYGFGFYRTRATCRNSHTSVRLTTTGECLDCTADRWTRWAARHPAKAKRERMLADKGVLLSV